MPTGTGSGINGGGVANVLTAKAYAFGNVLFKASAQIIDGNRLVSVL